MKRIILITMATAFLGSTLNAKIVTTKGTFLEFECGDACYSSFKTSSGVLLTVDSEYSIGEHLKVGKTYTITYDETIDVHPNDPEHRKLKYQFLKKVK